MIDKLPAMYLFTNDYITGTRTLSLAERGIYIDLLCFSQNTHGKGLPNDVRELAKMVLPFELDAEKNEENMASLIKVLNAKFYIENNRYFNKRQHLEYVKGLELSNTRSQARKKAKENFDTVLSDQKQIIVDKDKNEDEDKVKETNTNILALETLWKGLSVKMRQRSSKPKSFSKFKALTEAKQKLVIETYPEYCSQQGEFSTALERFIENEKYNEVQTPQSRKEEEKKNELHILKTRWEMSKKLGRPIFNMSQQDFDRAEVMFGKEKEEKTEKAET